MNTPQPHHNAAERLAVGCMTGTSIDGLDLALIQAEGRGLSMRVRVLDHRQTSLGDLAHELRNAAAQQPMTAQQFACLALRFGQHHADAIAAFLGPRSPDLIAVHGQTLFHQPPVSLQLINPFPIAARHACPVVCDLRQADLLAQGQGAPITPLADWVMMRGDLPRAVVNLGGFCNITLLPACPADHDPSDPVLLERIAGMDVCACNHVLDAVARAALNAPYDKDGQAALNGRADQSAVDDLAAMLTDQSRGGRSLGTGDEAAKWVERHTGRLEPRDLARSAVEAVARTIAHAAGATNAIFLAGGGALNRALAQSIAAHARRAVATTDNLGVPIAAREAAEIALLGLLARDGVDITLSQITHRRTRPVRAGSWVSPFDG